MNLGMFDHAMVLILVYILPIYGYFDHRRLERQVRDGVPGARTRAYYVTLIMEWALVAA